MRLTTLRHPVLTRRRARTMPRWVRRIDRTANRRINASRSWHAHDRGYSRLSHAADRGLLWYAIAALLVVLGRRRAALRGIGSMIIAGVVSDVIVKSFFDGRRPVFSEVPVTRRLRAYPTTPSFPSGHSASAAGFATGVALESGTCGARRRPAGGRRRVLPPARRRPLALGCDRRRRDRSRRRAARPAPHVRRGAGRGLLRTARPGRSVGSSSSAQRHDVEIRRIE